MIDPGVQHPIIPAAQTPIIGITVDLVVPCKVVFFERLRKFFEQKYDQLCGAARNAQYSYVFFQFDFQVDLAMMSKIRKIRRKFANRSI